MSRIDSAMTKEQTDQTMSGTPQYRDVDKNRERVTDSPESVTHQSRIDADDESASAGSTNSIEEDTANEKATIPTELDETQREDSEVAEK